MKPCATLKKEGFSLIEVVIAVTIMALIVGGMLGIIWQGAAAGERSKKRSVAYSLAREVLERYSDWSSLPADGSYTNPSPYPVTFNNVTYNINLGVSTVQAGLKQINVTITWSGDSFTIVTLKANY